MCHYTIFLVSFSQFLYKTFEDYAKVQPVDQKGIYVLHRFDISASPTESANRLAAVQREHHMLKACSQIHIQHVLKHATYTRCERSSSTWQTNHYYFLFLRYFHPKASFLGKTKVCWQHPNLSVNRYWHQKMIDTNSEGFILLNF